MYKEGSTVNININPDVSPPTITVASGLWTSDPTPLPNMAGINPRRANSIVIKRGLSWICAALNAASFMEIPSCDSLT